MQQISKADYQAWRHHPVTKEFLQYLRDYRSSLHNELLERWEAGTLVGDSLIEQEIRGRSLILKEIGELEFEAMEQFYGSEVTEDGNS